MVKSFTKFSGEVKITSIAGVTSYEVWINRKFVRNVENYAKALCWLDNYLHEVAFEECVKHVLKVEVMEQTCKE